jgi:hypothetical protein
MSIENGLRHRILTAANEAEIKDLLTTGSKFEFATEETKRRWKIAARRRTNALNGKTNVVEISAETVEDVTVKKRSKKKSR